MVGRLGPVGVLDCMASEHGLSLKAREGLVFGPVHVQQLIQSGGGEEPLFSFADSTQLHPTMSPDVVKMGTEQGAERLVPAQRGLSKIHDQLSIPLSSEGVDSPLQLVRLLPAEEHAVGRDDGHIIPEPDLDSHVSLCVEV